MHLLLWLPMLLPLLLVAGALYQYFGAIRDRRRYLPWGRMVDIGDGRKLYLHETGDKGPTVVFESGIGGTSLNWFALQEAVSGFARTVAYDRCGLGWSSACITERTPSNIARELRLMLRGASIEPPYILVGHSFGGLVVRAYAADFPEDVSGVVLVDAMRPQEWPPLNPRQQAHVDRGIRLFGIGGMLARFGVTRLVANSLLCHSGRISGAAGKVAGQGALHLLDRITSEMGKMPRIVWPVVAAHWSNPRFYRGMIAQLKAVPATVLEMQNAVPIAGIPVVLLTPGNAEVLCPESLRRIGPATQQVIAPKSGHWIHLDEPLIVIDAIRRMAAPQQVPATA
jgi:pimeloyl-ACP methyl ester carboxylesterase